MLELVLRAHLRERARRNARRCSAPGVSSMSTPTGVAKGAHFSDSVAARLSNARALLHKTRACDNTGYRVYQNKVWKKVGKNSLNFLIICDNFLKTIKKFLEIYRKSNEFFKMLLPV